jgi:hypothetical protein
MRDERLNVSDVREMTQPDNRFAAGVDVRLLSARRQRGAKAGRGKRDEVSAVHVVQMLENKFLEAPGTRNPRMAAPCRRRCPVAR